MKKNNYFFFVLFLIQVSSLSCSVAQKKQHRKQDERKPGWILNRPITKEYFTGINYSPKSQENYIDQAKVRALKDLSGEIVVKISGESMLNIIEVDDEIKQKYESKVKAITREQLEGYELYDTWQDKYEYWVFYRLSKAKYYRIKKEKFQSAIRQSTGLFNKARQSERQEHYYQALQHYLLASKPLEPYLAEAFDMELKHQCDELVNNIQSAIINIFSNIRLVTLTQKTSIKYGTIAEITLKLKAVFTDTLQNEHPVKNFPIVYDFIKGKGKLSTNLTTTDNQGLGITLLNSVASAEKLQIVEAKVDIEELLKEHKDEVLLYYSFKNITAPKTIFNINLQSTKIFINSVENNLSKPIEMKIIEPAVKKFFEDYGFEFTNSKVDAEFIIKIKVDTRKGSEAYEMYFSYLDMSFAIIDPKSGNQVFSRPFENLKGVKMDYTAAGHDAYRKLLRKFDRELYPELLEFFQLK